jgi:hypothetical protein
LQKFDKERVSGFYLQLDFLSNLLEHSLISTTCMTRDLNPVYVITPGSTVTGLVLLHCSALVSVC